LWGLFIFGVNKVFESVVGNNLIDNSLDYGVEVGALGVVGGADEVDAILADKFAASITTTIVMKISTPLKPLSMFSRLSSLDILIFHVMLKPLMNGLHLTIRSTQIDKV
jgi:hypothetical protein